MPRPRKWRRVCFLPQVTAFGPINSEEKTNECITMTVDEFEIIRLIDLERLSQDESANRMGVARSTVQRIYDDARKKLADCLVNGKALKIGGGDYKLCEGDEEFQYCGNRNCHRHRHGKI